jgi:hypothetical protein
VTRGEDAAAIVLQAAQRGFVGTTWAEVTALEATLARLAPEFSVPVAGAFQGLAALRRRHREAVAQARQLHGGRLGMVALLDRVDALDIYGAAAAVGALLDGPEALDELAERWSTDAPELAAWALAVAVVVDGTGDR